MEIACVPAYEQQKQHWPKQNKLGLRNLESALGENEVDCWNFPDSLLLITYINRSHITKLVLIIYFVR